MKRAMGAAAAVALLAGCASAADSAAPTPEAGSSAAVTPSATPEPEPETEEPEPEPVALDAGALAEALTGIVASAEGFEAYTEDTDPNDLIGRPGGYVSAAVIDDAALDGDTGVSRGAVIETFATDAEALARSEYIQSALKDAGPALGTEWHHVAGPALLRVSGDLKPSVNDAYAEAWAQVTK